ncbi:MAG: 2-C-methyl-D-erythritol 4-phosphate cytidylyltransferase [Wujia sp.]
MITAIILAAGVGSRMQSNTAKQFLKIGEREVLSYSLCAFQNHEAIDQIVLVTKAEYVEHCRKELVEKYELTKIKEICIGGKERFDSVYEGLSVINQVSEKDLVLIHDGARPFVDQDMITRSISCAKEYGACTVGVAVKDTIKVVDEKQYGIETPERASLYQIQTPQTFRLSLIKKSYEIMKKVNKDGRINHKITDDTMLVEQYGGVRCKVIPGSYENIKITTPEDLEIASIFAKKLFQKN